MNVADNATARRHVSHERVLNGITAARIRARRMIRVFIRLGRSYGIRCRGIQRSVDAEAFAADPVARPKRAMYRASVVGIDDVAGGAAAGAVIAGMIVGAQEIERGIEEPGLLK